MATSRERNAHPAPRVIDTSTTFEKLGVVEELCSACTRVGWKAPTRIQVEALPVALAGKDIIGIAQTGSGKTGAFILPMLQALLDKPQRLFGLVLTPTRELAFQIGQQFTALGEDIGLECVVIIGGIKMSTQALMLRKKPHIVVATPGRLIDHLENTRGFDLRFLKCLVMDEADRILDMNFQDELVRILKLIPRERTTYLYSATMTSKVALLQRASLKDPVKVEVSEKYQTVDTLFQHYVFIPWKFKHAYLVWILKRMTGSSVIVFCDRCDDAQRVTLMLRKLGFTAIPLHGKMRQERRLEALNKYKTKEKGVAILVATDVASRGLDIPHVDVVMVLDVPIDPKDYIHRVGRTARAGRYGRAITFVSQYELMLYLRIEKFIKKKLPVYPTDKPQVMQLQERVAEAERKARLEFSEFQKAMKKRKRDADDDDNNGTKRNAKRKRNNFFRK